jgi:hypothetical protein
MFELIENVTRRPLQYSQNKMKRNSKKPTQVFSTLLGNLGNPSSIREPKVVPISA